MDPKFLNSPFKNNSELISLTPSYLLSIVAANHHLH